MAESAIKGLESNDRDAAIRSSSISEISVEGYDESRWRQKYALRLALTKHFAECGTILFVCIRRSGVAFIRFKGEGAQDKALKLDGTDMGGWTAIVKPSEPPSDPRDFDPSVERMEKCNEHCIMSVSGYDTALAEIDIQIALCKHFSSCGVVDNVIFSMRRALVHIEGENCKEKALALNGQQMGQVNLVVKSVNGGEPSYVPYRPRLCPRNSCGYSLQCAKKDIEMEKKKKEMAKKKMEMEKKKKEMAKEKRKMAREKKKKMEMEKS